MAIRRSMPADEAAIREVYVEASRDDASSPQTEHLTVDELRAADALELSLVAEVDSRVGGHIAFSAATVGDASSGWYLVGPLAVVPEWQRNDTAGLLLLAGVNAMQMARRADGLIAVGDPAFYGRFGFAPCEGVTMAGVPDEQVLCRSFKEGAAAPVGEVRRHPAYSL